MIVAKLVPSVARNVNQLADPRSTVLRDVMSAEAPGCAAKVVGEQILRLRQEDGKIRNHTAQCNRQTSGMFAR